ncbi:MAG: DegT/DnrJ/EryC1/StrS family aminotransferase [Candidatus Pacebacteria bacterium]|nr:DegT/DnrJ/EryC1/StrS family aminotransferase [Candidatus Paceibacterota bacterium]
MKKENTKPILQTEPWFDDMEAEAVSAYIKEGGWITEFKKTKEFEESIAQFVGSKYCLTAPNGTLTLVMALIACGVGPEDEVIVPDMTMVATANAVKLAGAEVVFADVERENLCLSLETILPKVTKKTRAIMLVTFNGRYPAHLGKIVQFCKEKKIWLIEDAAQSLGSYKGGKHLGTFGDIGSFSFSVPKIISTGQGGALVTNDASLYKKLKLIKDFGRESGGSDHYLSVGWNFKFTDLQAVVGLEQMKKLPWRINRKKEIYRLYQEKLKKCSGISLIETNLEDTVPWFVDILVSDKKRGALIEFLKKHDIGSRPGYPALHSEPAYRYKGSFPTTEKIAEELLWLPSSSKLTDEEIEKVTDTIIEFFKK